MNTRIYNPSEDERKQEKLPFATFEIRAVENRQKSIEADYTVYEDREFILIHAPGGKDIVEKEVDDEIRRKYGPYYQAWKEGIDPPTNGSSLKGWPLITPAQIKNCHELGIRSVEDLSQMNEEAMRRLGMGARSLKDKANTWLSSAKDHGKVSQQVDVLMREMDAMKEKMEATAKTDASKDKIIADLQAELADKDKQLSDGARGKTLTLAKNAAK